MITLTLGAQERLPQIRSKANVPAELCVRIKVIGGGCAGFTYDMYFDRPQSDDVKVPVGGETILLDPLTITYMSGTVVDAGPQGFVFQNPQAKVHCNCGASFRNFKT